MYKEIENLIKERAKLVQRNLDEVSLKYYTNYFYVLQNNPILPNGITIEELIDNALRYKFKFFDEEDQINKIYGKSFNGVTVSTAKKDKHTGVALTDEYTMYIRDNLQEPLREMIIYHELHHAVQTNPKTEGVGINQRSGIGRLIMEAQTQYFAEKVYQEINKVQFEEREIPSENLRMKENGIVISSLHNYQMHDNLLTKLAIMLNVSKDYFISINFLNENDLGLRDFERRYNIIKEKYNFEYPFSSFLFMLDYIYFVDLEIYTNRPGKEIILSNRTVPKPQEIHPRTLGLLSLKQQRENLDKVDKLFFEVISTYENNYIELLRYIVDNDLRKELEQKALTNTSNKKR